MISSFNTHRRALVIILLVIIACAVGTFLVISPYSPFTGLQNDLKAIEPSIEASYTDLDGNPIVLSSFKGKSLVINSWASWMPFSKDELNLLNERQRQHGDSLHILAINRMEDKEFIKSYLSALAIDRDILYLVDPTDNFYRAILGYAMPETVFYRKDGTLSAHKRGVLTEQELDQYIDTILE